MYVKLFTSLYQGTLRGNSHGILVFTNLLAHTDKAGIVDIHPRAIADEVGITVDQVNAALLELESPDPESRSPEHDGRRIIRLDEHRAWGWLVVNFLKYRAIRDEEDRREQNRESQARWREKHKPSVTTDKPHKPRSSHTEAEAEAIEIEAAPLVPAATPQPRVAPCQTEKVLALFHEHLPMLPAVVVVNASRKAALSARWREVITAEKFTPEQGVEWFSWFFGYVAKSRFLTGRAPGRDGRAWKADFDWLMKPANFAKTVEGNYHKELAA